MTDIDLTTYPREITTDDGIRVLIAWGVEWHRPDDRDREVAHVERGHCLRLPDVAGHEDSIVDPHHEYGYVRFTWHDRPTRIDGVAEEDIPAAVELLVDVARAHRTHVRLRTQRAARTLEVLRERAAQREAARTAGQPGHERWDAMQRAGGALENALMTAIADQLVHPDDLCQAAGVDRTYLEQLRQHVDRPRTPRMYVGDQGFADRLGVTVGTLRAYKSRGQIPAPDIELGGSDGWLIDTVEAYARTRPGQGARTDLT